MGHRWCAFSEDRYASRTCRRRHTDSCRNERLPVGACLPKTLRKLDLSLRGFPLTFKI